MPRRTDEPTFTDFLLPNNIGPSRGTSKLRRLVRCRHLRTFIPQRLSLMRIIWPTRCESYVFDLGSFTDYRFTNTALGVVIIEL